MQGESPLNNQPPGPRLLSTRFLEMLPRTEAESVQVRCRREISILLKI